MTSRPDGPPGTGSPGTGSPPGGDGTVRVALDARGVPTLTGPDRPSVAYGLGWVTARDRLFQLDLYRRRALGRTAEVFGPAALPHDVAQRTLGLHLAAERMADELPRWQRDLLEAYAAGVNDRLHATDALPLEFTLAGTEPAPWRPADSAAVALLLAQMLGGDGATLRMRTVMDDALPPDVVRFLLPRSGPYAVDIAGTPAAPHRGTPAVPPDLAAALAHLAGTAAPATGDPVVGTDESPFGSNAWAVAGRRTADGRSIVANDMHLPLTAPCIFYRARLRYAGHRVDGVVAPGVPLIVAGSSARVAWGVTRLVADNVDLVALDVPADAPDHYRTATGLEAFGVRTETIEVRGAEQATVEVRDTRWGPVYGPTVCGAPVALRWRPLEPGGLDLGLAGLAESTDVVGACDAANRAAGPPLNVVVGDADGRVAWTVTGSFPVHPGGDRRVVRPHAGGRSWERCRAPAELPRVVDPASGLVVVANNLTPQHAATGGLADNGFSARRAHRVAAVVDALPPVSEPDMLRLQRDDDAAFYAFYRDLVREAVDGHAGRLSAHQRDALAAVDAWDGTAGVQARGLAVLMAFRENLRETLFAAVLAPCRRLDPGFRYGWHDHESALRALLAATDPPVVPPPYRGRTQLLLAHLELSAAMLRAAAGGRPMADVPWGELNLSTVRHPLSSAFPELSDVLDLPDVPMPGCAESVHAAHPGFGPAVAFVVSPAHVGDGLLRLPGGQAGDPRLPTYADQFAAWSTGVPAALCPGPPVVELVLAGPPPRPVEAS